MEITNLNHDEINAILKQYEYFILIQARRNVPRQIVPAANIEKAINEIQQGVRIKLWLALERKPITYIKSYIRRIAQTERADMIRRYKPIQPLPLDDDGELLSFGQLLTPTNPDTRDPCEILIQKEADADTIALAVDSTCRLPPRQQRAMICNLKEQLDSCLEEVNKALKERNIAISDQNWPTNKQEKQSLKANLQPAYQRLRRMWRSS